jgi:iron complex outermembrane receptor protein
MIARFLLLAGVALPALASPALASEPEADEPQATAAGGDGDIIVTARRRSESLQDVPAAVSVIGDTQLDATGTFNIARLGQLQPSIQFYSSNPRNTAVNIRGLGAPFGLTNDGIEQGVGLYVDQVYYSRIASTTFDFLDLERIEVLRGPQGTLYGKNTTAGAVNLVSRAPTFDFEGRGEVTLGNLDYVQARGAISGPLVADKLAFRIAGSLTRRRGTIYNVTSGRYINELDNQGVRAQLLWRPTPNLDVTLAGDYSHQDPECCAQIFARVGLTQRPLNRQYEALAAALGYAPPSTNPFDRLTDVDTPLRARQSLGGVSLRAEWRVGPGTLTSISAWRFWDWDPSNDRDFIGLPITTISQNPSQQDQWTQEVRYAASIGRIDFVVGAFGFHQRLDTQGLQAQGPAASRWLLDPGNVPPGATGCNPPTANACNPAVLDGLTSTNTIGLSNTSLALFGQLTWRVTDRLRLQPGLRVNYDWKRGVYDAVVTNGEGSTSLNADQRRTLAPQSYEARFSDWNLSGDFTLSYDLAEDVLAYVTYARAFKSGGVNLSGLPLDGANNPILAAASVRPESVNHYEAGLKTRLLNRLVTLNIAAYRSDVDDYQATVTNGQLGVLRGYLANAGKVRVQGVEVELSARPTRRFSLYLTGAFTDGRYVRFVDAPCPPELSGGTTAGAGQSPSPPGTPGGISPANCDISGQWLPGISRWSASYGAEYSIPLPRSSRGGELFLAFDGNFRTRFSSLPSRSIYTDINGYSLENFRVGYRDDRWELSGWVRNAFNTHYFEQLATQSGNTGLIVGQPGDPRTWGVTVSHRF